MTPLATIRTFALGVIVVVLVLAGCSLARVLSSH